MQQNFGVLDAVHNALPAVLDGHSRNYANKTAIACDGARLSWAQFGSRLNTFANLLTGWGIGRGDRVVILGSNSIDALVAIFGVMKAGACAVPLSTMLSSEQLAVMISDTGAKAVCVSHECAPLVEPVRESITGIPRSGWLALDFVGDSWQSYPSLVSGVRDDRIERHYDALDPCMIIYSSGTTGSPKGIVHSHYSRYALAQLCALEMRFNYQSRVLTTTSIYSMGTFLMMLPVFLVGGTLTVMRKFSPAGFLSLVASQKITHSFMVPSQLLMLVNEQPSQPVQLTSMECLLSAGSPLRGELKHEILRRFTPNLFELYGNSEGFATMLKPEQQAEHGNTVGTPLIGYNIEIVDSNGGCLPPGEPGEIVGYGASLMMRYHNQPEETAKAIWRHPGGRTFVRTGDIGKVDESGFVTILDRKKDMIISGGFNVFPTDIESVIGRHEAVLDSAVIGVPHPKWDEAPYAFVICKPGYKLTADELLQWVNTRVAKTQRMLGVQFVEELPRNTLGKVLKRTLRETYAAQTNG